MENKKVTSLEVAKLAGVSQSAVSRVFTPGASSSKKTNELVRKAAAKLGYRPNVLARSLITGRSRMYEDICRYFFYEFSSANNKILLPGQLLHLFLNFCQH